VIKNLIEGTNLHALLKIVHNLVNDLTNFMYDQYLGSKTFFSARNKIVNSINLGSITFFLMSNYLELVCYPKVYCVCAVLFNMADFNVLY